MQLKDVWEQVYAHTGKASDVARSLALAALAMVWLFRDPKNVLPPILLVPSTFVVLALGLDLVQYVVAGARWQIFVWETERRTDLGVLTLETEIGAAPKEINLWAYVLYYVKIVFVILAYAGLLAYVLGAVFGH